MIKIKLLILLISAPFNLSHDLAMQAYNETRQVYATELSIDLRLQKVRTRTDLYPNLTHLSQQYDRYYAWKAWLILHNRLRRKRLTYLMLSPSTQDGKRWMSGLTEVGTYLRRPGFASGTGEEYNQDGAYRMEHTAKIMQHELAHSLGAGHDNDLPVSIMNANMLPYVDGNELHFSDKTKQEIQNFLN